MSDEDRDGTALGDGNHRDSAPEADRGRYFDEIEVGETHEHGTYAVTEAEIVEFAARYDPRPFHTDPEAAKESIYGGLIASGWHTGSIGMRLLSESFLRGIASQGSPGVDELRWLRPVRPGDELSVRAEVVGKTPSESRPERGLLQAAVTVVDGDGEAVMTMRPMVMVERRLG